MFKSQAFGCDGIQMRGLIGGATIDPEALVTEIICHDQHNIGWSGASGARPGHENPQHQDKGLPP